MQANRFYVYEHLSKDTGSVFYVGKGTGKRAYLSNRLHRNQHWMRHVKKHGGFNVRFVVFDEPEEFAFLVEAERIDQLRRQGIKLCNQTDGGDGTSGWVKSKEWKEKVGAAHRGKVVSPETRAKISASVKTCGFVHTEEMRKKMSEAHKGHQRNIGRKQSDEEKVKRAVKLIGNKSRTGQTRSQEERSKVSAAMKGRPQGILICPHCHKAGGNIMRRHHFDNCKAKICSLD